MFLQTSLHRFKIFYQDELRSRCFIVVIAMTPVLASRVSVATCATRILFLTCLLFIIKVFLLSKAIFSKAKTRHCVSKFDKVDALLNLFFVLFKSRAPSHHSYINFMTSSMDHENSFTRRLRRRMRRCARPLLLSGFGSFHFASLRNWLTVSDFFWAGSCFSLDHVFLSFYKFCDLNLCYSFIEIIMFVCFDFKSVNVY